MDRCATCEHGASRRFPALAGMVIAIAGTVAAIALTAFRAGPTHRRLDSGLDPVLIGRLLTCDRWRTAAAVLALAGAVLLAIG